MSSSGANYAADWLAENLVCPRDHQPLQAAADSLRCLSGHVYPCFDGVPVMLLEEMKPTHGVCVRSVERARSGCGSAESRPPADGLQVDPFVEQAVAGTCGIMYKPLIGRLPRYPIPRLRLPAASGEVFLDIGCNWGRWCISAARKSYTAIGLDPSLDAVLAARRVSRQLSIPAAYLVADARCLPFRTGSVATVFSYSVLQHFSNEDVRSCLSEVARVLRPGGTSMIQMANIFGVRSLYHVVRRSLVGAVGRLARRTNPVDPFEVRYWRPCELRRVFAGVLGPTRLTVDGYFGLGIQPSDADLLPLRYRAVVRTSECLRALSDRLPLMDCLADSLYVTSTRESGGREQETADCCVEGIH